MPSASWDNTFPKDRDNFCPESKAGDRTRPIPCFKPRSTVDRCDPFFQNDVSIFGCFTGHHDRESLFGPLVKGKPLDPLEDRKSTRLNSSHLKISYAVFC